MSSIRIAAAAVLALAATPALTHAGDFPHVRNTPEILDQDRRTEALNAEVNRANAGIEAQNAARRAAYEADLASYHQAKADYEAKLAAQKAADEQAQAAYQHAKAEWAARVAACQAGDRKACEGGQAAGAPGL